MTARSEAIEAAARNLLEEVRWYGVGSPHPSDVAALRAALALPREEGRIVEFNINSDVWVRLTEVGRRARKQHWKELRMPMEQAPLAEQDGWSRWQLWDLMAIFGGCTGNGLAVPFETTIRLAAPPPPQPTERSAVDAMLGAFVADPRLPPGEAYMISAVKVVNLAPPQPDAVSPSTETGAKICLACGGLGALLTPNGHSHVDCLTCKGTGSHP